MYKLIKLFIILLICITMISSCKPSTPAFYAKSRMAGGPGEYLNVIDAYVDEKSKSISDNNTVTFKIGVGGGRNHPEANMHLEIAAEGCEINGCKDTFIKEYSDFYTNDKYDVIVKNRWLLYPDKTPIYHEEFTISFPTTLCNGKIIIKLIDEADGYEGHTVELEIYYASNGSVIWFSKAPIAEIDDNNKPIYVDQ